MAERPAKRPRVNTRDCSSGKAGATPLSRADSALVKPAPCAQPSTAPPPVRYDFAALAAAFPELGPFMRSRKPSSVDFSRPGATLALTRAILSRHFGLQLQLPAGQLVPTVPARQQYLSWAHALLGHHRGENVATGTLLDIGTGPSAIYALLASRLFGEGWCVVATDIDQAAIASARENIALNSLEGTIELMQTQECESFVPEDDIFHRLGAPLKLTVCNPPFYEEGQVPSARPRPGSDFQLETQGGEFAFLCRLARDSREHCDVWFTSLVGIKSDLARIVQYLRSPDISAAQVVTTQLAAGKRTSRWAVAWRIESCAESSVDIEEGVRTSKWRSTLRVQLGVSLQQNSDGDGSRLLKTLLESAVREDSRWRVLSKGSNSLISMLELSSSDGAEASCVISARDNRRGIYAIEVKVGKGVGCLSAGAWELASQVASRLRASLLDPARSEC